jgi:hypothetical protein
VPVLAAMAPPVRHALSMMCALTLAASASRGLAGAVLSVVLLVCAGETWLWLVVGVKMAEMVCVKFEYISNEKSQDLYGGGEHTGSGSIELVPSFRCGTGKGGEGEGAVHWNMSCCLARCFLCTGGNVM